MNRTTSKSLSFALTFALSALGLGLAGCSSTPTDDVYTADENTPSVGAIARDEAAYPIAAGTMVPNANGVAVPLTTTMQGLRVELYDMVVMGNCEPSDEEQGEFYYQIDVNGRAIARRDSSHTTNAGYGESIGVNAKRVFFVDEGEVFKLNFGVSEQDDFMNGKDDFVGARAIPLTTADVQAGNFVETIDIGSGSCKVQAQYSLSLVQKFIAK